MVTAHRAGKPQPSVRRAGSPSAADGSRSEPSEPFRVRTRVEDPARAATAARRRHAAVSPSRSRAAGPTTSSTCSGVGLLTLDLAALPATRSTVSFSEAPARIGVRRQGAAIVGPVGTPAARRVPPSGTHRRPVEPHPIRRAAVPSREQSDSRAADLFCAIDEKATSSSSVGASRSTPVAPAEHELVVGDSKQLPGARSPPVFLQMALIE